MLLPVQKVQPPQWLSNAINTFSQVMLGQWISQKEKYCGESVLQYANEQKSFITRHYLNIGKNGFMHREANTFLTLKVKPNLFHQSKS